MKENFLSKRLPTILALIIILASIWSTSILIKRGVITIGKADENISPKNLKIVNISDTSFTITFTTLDKTKAIVNFGENQELGNIAEDNRNKIGNSQRLYNSHFITISGTKPNTNYYFSLTIGDKTFTDNGKNYSINTAGTINALGLEQPKLKGKAILNDGLYANDALVYLKTDDSQEIATYTNSNGEYSLDTNQLRTTDLNNYKYLKDGTIFSLEIIRGNMQSLVKSDYKKDGLIPLVTLSQNYDFLTKVEPKDYEASPSSLLEVPVSSVVSATNTAELEIIRPEENEGLVDQKPRFEGIAAPGTKVKITVNSENTIQTEVIADKNGIWSFRPDIALPPGEHTIIAEITDSFGIINQISKKFTVYAQGSQIIQSATPSAYMTQSPTPTKTIARVLSPSPTATRTPTPTLTLIPTRTTGIGGFITPSPTLSPYQTVSISPTFASSISAPTPSIAEPGSTNSSIIIVSVSLFLILAGSILLFIV